MNFDIACIDFDVCALQALIARAYADGRAVIRILFADDQRIVAVQRVVRCGNIERAALDVQRRFGVDRVVDGGIDI